MELCRARHSALAVVATLLVPAIALAACTISSESPGAATLGGPTGGTTTTASGDSGGSGAEAGVAGAATEVEEEAPTGETAVSATTPGVPAAPAAPDVGEVEAPVEDVVATDGPDPATGEQDSESTGQPATAERDSESVDGTATTGTVGDAEATDGDPDTVGDTTATTTGTVVVSEAAFDERSKVSTVGIGAVYFGMTPEEAAERVGSVWAGIPAGGADCYVITPTNGPPGVALWVYHGTVERVDIDTPLLRTQSSLGVGTHLGELRSSLGDKLLVEEHPYLAGWILATFVPTDPNDAAFRIAFDISGGEVIRFRAGRTEIVALEGCA